MKKYFEKLQSIGLEALVELRKMSNQHADQLVDYWEQVVKGESTEMGYQNLKRSLEHRYAGVKGEYVAKLEALEKQFVAAVDEYTMPSASFINSGDAEVLKNFELSPAEFERMAAKYQDNPTMGRMLEDYRLSHEGKQLGRGVDATTWRTNWRYQSAERRKEIFKSASNSVYYIITGTLSDTGEYRVKKRVSEEYHKLHGSDPKALPTPKAPEVKSAMDRITERGGFFF